MKLLSFGEIIYDVYESGECTLGGAPLNFASYIRLLGEEVWLSSAVGCDSYGKMAREDVIRLGIHTDYLRQVPEKRTGACVVSLGNGGVPSYQILDDVAYDYIQVPPEMQTDIDIIAFGTLALRHEHNRNVLRSILNVGGFREVFVDLNLRKPFYSSLSIDFCLSYATIAKISEEELPEVCRTMFGDYVSLCSAKEKIMSSYPNIRLLLITSGEDGAICYDLSTGREYRCDAIKCEVVSTVGAGDSFGASFLVEYERSHDIERALALGALVSAFVVSHREAIVPQVKERIDMFYAGLR